MRIQDKPATTEVGTQGCSEELSPHAKVVYKLIEAQLNDPLNRSKSGTISVRATENREEFEAAVRAIDEAARAFEDNDWRTDVRHHEGFKSKKAGQKPVTINESYSLLVLR